MTETKGQPPQENHPDYAVACRLERFAQRIYKAGTRAAAVAKLGLALLKEGIAAKVLDRLNLMSDIANGEYEGMLSERTLDALFENEDVLKHLLPLLVKEMESDPIFEANLKTQFGEHSVQRWRNQCLGALFSDDNVRAGQESGQDLRIRQNMDRLLGDIVVQPAIAVDF